MQVMIRYKLNPDQVQEHSDLLEAYQQELKSVQPEGLRELILVEDDGVSFVHIVETDGQGPGPLPHLPAFQRYRSTLDDRCEEPPVLTVLNQVGSYRFK